MAGAAKSDEIEDVLSSIRRLVSEHQPPERADALQVEPPATATAIPLAAVPEDRLILTPALRVTDPEDPWVPITSRTSEEVEEAQEEVQEDTQDVLDAVEAVTRDEGADWAQALWEDGDPEAMSEDTDIASEDLGPDPQLLADQWEEADAVTRQVAAESVDDPVHDALDAPLDVTEAARTTPDQDADPTQSEDLADIPLSFIRSTASVSDYEPAEENIATEAQDLPEPTLQLAEARGAHPQSVAGPDKDPRHVRVEIVRASSSLHDPEADSAADTRDDTEAAAGLSGADQVLEPSDPETPAEADWTTAALEADHTAQATPEGAWNDDSPPPAEQTVTAPPSDLSDVIAEPETEADPVPGDDMVEDMGEGQFNFPDDSDDFVDEEALRQIVAEIVREELQGDLGVRITRNVRKLVRREIRLALAAQEID